MHIITSTTRSLSSQHKRLNDETTNVSSRKIIFPSISPRPPEKRSVKNLNDKKKKKNPFLPVTYRQFRDSDIVRARVLMRRDYYIISTPKISIINPAYRFLFALLQNSRWNHVPTCALFTSPTKRPTITNGPRTRVIMTYAVANTLVTTARARVRLDEYAFVETTGEVGRRGQYIRPLSGRTLTKAKS